MRYKRLDLPLNAQKVLCIFGRKYTSGSCFKNSDSRVRYWFFIGKYSQRMASWLLAIISPCCSNAKQMDCSSYPPDFEYSVMISLSSELSIQEVLCVWLRFTTPARLQPFYSKSPSSRYLPFRQIRYIHKAQAASVHCQRSKSVGQRRSESKVAEDFPMNSKEHSERFLETNQKRRTNQPAHQRREARMSVKGI